MALGQRKGLERRSEEAGRESVVLARGVAVSALEAGDVITDDLDPPCEVKKFAGVRTGEGSREELGVLAGVLSVEYSSWGGTQLDGLPGSLVELLPDCGWSS